MGDNGKKESDLQNEEIKPQEPAKFLHIELADNDFDIRVTGITGDIKNSLYMLELAKDLLKAAFANRNSPKIVKPGGIMSFARRFK
jgi:hypothetical protein